MNRIRILFILLISSTSLLLFSGCSTPVTPEPTSTDLPPTPTEIPIEIELNFDGESCVLTSPNSLSPGEYAVRMINKSEYKVGIWCSRLAEGHTVEDLDAMQEEPGKYFKAPDWVISLSKIKSSKDTEGNSIAFFEFDQPGEYACSTGSTMPLTLYGCGNLFIVKD